MYAYVGSGPYCYANALSSAIGCTRSPALLETLTGSAFGFQVVDGVPYFDPVGWDPDQGIDQALDLLGWTSERRSFPDAAQAYQELMRHTERSPVFVGPLEMGLLLHQPGSDRPLGADHFVTVLEADSEGVLMHDPQGFPYAWLPREVFLSAWGSPIGYCVGGFPLRTMFQQVTERSAKEALSDLLPLAAAWAAAPENGSALRDFARRAAAGLDEDVAAVLGGFSLRLAARRRLDAAQSLAGCGEVPDLLDQQARLLGRAQYEVVRGDCSRLAELLERVADLHDFLTERLRSYRRVEELRR